MPAPRFIRGLLATYAPSATGVMRQQQGLLLIGIGQAHPGYYNGAPLAILWADPRILWAPRNNLFLQGPALANSRVGRLLQILFLCDTGTTGDETTPSSKPTAVPTSNTSRAYEPYTTYGGYAATSCNTGTLSYLQSIIHHPFISLVNNRTRHKCYYWY